MLSSRLHALQRLCTGFVARPQAGTLVVACSDPEVTYLTHCLTKLDETSPADRFLVLPHPFKDLYDYTQTFAEATLQPPPVTTIQATIDAHLAALPEGDHRLVCALVPTEISAPAQFSALAEALMAAVADPRLRLILRDDRADPRHVTTAAASARDFAYTFMFTPETIAEELAHIADNPRKPPDDRAQALLQLAALDLGHGRLTDALARCQAVTCLATAPASQALALTLLADIYRVGGETDMALALGAQAMLQADDAKAPTIVVHAGLAMGKLTAELGRYDQAALCFDLAERAATLNPDQQTHIRAERARWIDHHANSR